MAAPAALIPPLAQRRPCALYIHIPFCARRCPYCDFAVAPRRAELEAQTLSALEAEARARLPEGFAPRTVFIGGGTPTELSLDGLRRLGALLAPHLSAAREVTIEANPGTLTPAKLALLPEMGITRVSLGAQSFNDEALATLGRLHRRHHILKSVAALREVGITNINIDLIFGIPGQSLDALAADLDALLDLELPHVSAYGLTYEPGTRFFAERAAGRLKAATEGAESRQFDLIRGRLRAAGYAHYEVSNYAKPGFSCAHNRITWRNGSYVGLGNSAVSHIGGQRLRNARDLRGYIARVGRRGRAIVEVESLSLDEKVRESAYLALRTARGIDPAIFERDLGVDPLSRFAEPFERLLGLGLLERRGPRLRLSAAGVPLADSIAMEVL